MGARYVRKGEWKLLSPAKDTTWHLYRINSDKPESDDMAGVYPDNVKELAGTCKTGLNRQCSSKSRQTLIKIVKELVKSLRGANRIVNASLAFITEVIFGVDGLFVFVVRLTINCIIVIN